MKELADLVNQVIESRLDGKIHDDTNEVVNLLIAVRECGRKNLRKQADDWIDELEKRRHRRKVDHQYAEYDEKDDIEDDESPKPKRRRVRSVKSEPPKKSHTKTTNIIIHFQQLSESTTEKPLYKILNITQDGEPFNLTSSSYRSSRTRRKTTKYANEQVDFEDEADYDDLDDEDYK